jgi:hypothetical protein
MCSWCKQVRLAEAVWVEVEEALVQLGLLELESLPQITLGACQACYADIMLALSASPD